MLLVTGPYVVPLILLTCTYVACLVVLQDEDPYVRKTAAVCVAQLYDINSSMVEDQGFLELLKEMLSDSNPMVRCQLESLTCVASSYSLLQYLYPFCYSSILSLVHSVTHPFCHSSILSLVHSVTGPFCHWSILSLVHSVTGPFCHWSILSLVHSVTWCRWLPMLWLH